MKVHVRDTIKNVAIGLIISLIGIFVVTRYAEGNVLVKANGDSMIYHLPWCESYDATIIGNNPEDRYFLLESSAVAEGYRMAENCYN